ncbi:hypothetical protein V6N13_148157 [Hibiscus sabdariffa]
MVVLLWHIWNRRNLKVHNDNVPPPWLTVLNARKLQQEFLGTLLNQPGSAISRPTSGTSWKKPKSDIIKINFDGAYRSTNGAAAVRVVARDNHGMVVAGCCKYIAESNNAFVVEAFACFEAILLALDRRWSKVEITGYAANVINMLNDPVSGISTLENYLTEARALMQQHPHLKIGYTPRSANVVAHTLANWALIQQTSFYFYFECPECISACALNDATFG